MDDGVTWRPMRPEDAPAIVELFNAAEPLDGTGEHVDVDDVIEQFVN